MYLLLDTNILIDLFRRGTVIEDQILKEKLSLSVINYLEIEYGNKNSPLRNLQTLRFQQFLEENNVNVLPVNIKIAKKQVDIKIHLEKKGKKLDDFDLLIAATCLTYDLTLVTRNKKHFERIPGLKIY